MTYAANAPPAARSFSESVSSFSYVFSCLLYCKIKHLNWKMQGKEQKNGSVEPFFLALLAPWNRRYTRMMQPMAFRNIMESRGHDTHKYFRIKRLRSRRRHKTLQSCNLAILQGVFTFVGDVFLIIIYIIIYIIIRTPYKGIF